MIVLFLHFFFQIFLFEFRNEFARQIREESQRLQETRYAYHGPLKWHFQVKLLALYTIFFYYYFVSFRGELEQQRRARLNEVQTPQQIR